MDLFLQFYNHVNFDYTTRKPTTYLENGFSYIEEVEPLWVDFAAPLACGDKIRQADTTYISLWSWPEYKRAFAWATTYFPSKKFVFGGPLIRFFSGFVKFNEIAMHPKNVTINTGLAEDVIGKQVDKKSWTLTLPPDIQHPFYSYHVQDGCYWNKCSFCHYPTNTERGATFDIEPLYAAPAGTVWLECPSMPPRHLSSLIDLDYSNKEYQLFIRGEGQICQVLEEMLPRLPHPEKLMFRIGVEFPSDRMLARMNKGATVKEIAQVSNLLYTFGCRQMLLYICGWQDLKEEDLISAEKFFSSLLDKEDKLTLHSVSRLVDFSGGYAAHHKYFKRYWHFHALSEEDLIRDKQWRSMISSRSGSVDNPFFEWTMRLPTDEDLQIL